MTAPLPFRQRASATSLARGVVAAIERARIQITTEDLAHESIAAALSGAGILAEREVVLDTASRVDFLTRDGIAIEAKVKGQRRSIWRQACRYAAHPRVAAVVIATSVALPRDLGEVEGKPILTASLSRGWL